MVKKKPILLTILLWLMFIALNLIIFHNIIKANNTKLILMNINLLCYTFVTQIHHTRVAISL